MDYEDFVNFRSKFYFYCGKEFFLKELGIKSEKERPIPRNYVVLCEMIKKRGAQIPNFYGYYDLWRSCNENIMVEYNPVEKKFLFRKKFEDNIKNEELYDLVNYKISSFDGSSQKFGKSVKFFKYLCAFIYAKNAHEKVKLEDILDKIENDRIQIPSFEKWNRSISKVVWDKESKILKLEKIDFNPKIDQRKSKKRSWFSVKGKTVFRDNIGSNAESNGLSDDCKHQFSNIDPEDENYVHPEDIFWDYDAILNERILDGKIQFLVKWKDFGSYKFEPSWENESIVNCAFSRKKREPIKKFCHIEDIENPSEVIEFYNKMNK